MKEKRNSPFGVHLQWFGDADPQGQAMDTPVEPDGQGGEPTEPYFSVDVPGDSGNEILNFASPDELKQAFRENYMRHSTFTKRRMEDAEVRKSLDTDKQTYAQLLSDLNRQREEFNKKKEQYDNWDSALKNNPKLFNQLQNLRNQPLDGNDIVSVVKNVINEELGGTMKELTDFRREQQLSQERKAAYEKVRKMYPDFDGNAVDKVYDELAAGDISTLVEALYHAHKGRSIDPMKIKEKLTDDLTKKQGASLPSSQGSKPPSGERKVPGSIDEALEKLASNNYE